ncbi:MAG: type II toxin-antitoxin system VapC family toxin [Verrucomicrobia bacterium]|nr:type II toxin-antitoxin system VapC family toxin [Verrucomicrobiota bacterium]
MQYVLDTCTFLWLATSQRKLSAPAQQTIADLNHTLHISAITVTETHRLVRKGKITLQANMSLDVWFRAALAQHQVRCEPITLEIAHAAEILPAIHNDPADRFILATAQVMGARVLSPDGIMPQYPGFTVEW